MALKRLVTPLAHAFCEKKSDLLSGVVGVLYNESCETTTRSGLRLLMTASTHLCQESHECKPPNLAGTNRINHSNQ